MVISDTESQPDILLRLIEIHRALGAPSDAHATMRSVNFMAYELAALLQSQPPENVLREFNRFFFEQKNFRLSPVYNSLESLLDRREGCAILVALLYLHLAGSCGLKMNLIHWPLHTVIRWESSPGKFAYIDLEKNGELMKPEDTLALVCKHKKEMLPLKTQEAVAQYLAYLALHFRNLQEYENLHTVLGLILDIEPENTRYMAERAILRRDLGLVKEALQDLKRYFAFTNSDSTAPEILAVYNELKAMAPALS